jgi:hypothetical protein
MSKQIVYVTRDFSLSNDVEIWSHKPQYDVDKGTWNHTHENRHVTPPMSACIIGFSDFLGWSEEELLEWTADGYYFELEISVR